MSYVKYVWMIYVGYLWSFHFAVHFSAVESQFYVVLRFPWYQTCGFEVLAFSLLFWLLLFVFVTLCRDHDVHSCCMVCL